MATETRGSSHGFLYFMVGALVIGVAVIAFMFYSGQRAPAASTSTAIERSADAIGDAADDIGDAAREINRDG